MVSPRLKTYGIVAGIFVLGAAAGGGAGYAVASKHVTEVLGDGPGASDARRFQGLARRLDLSSEQRDKVRSIMERHREEKRRLTAEMFEKSGGELEALHKRVDDEIRAVLSEEQKQQFNELMEKRKRRLPFGEGGGHRRKRGDKD
jgi:Spy/CpxP family protein refolding chaperone